MGEAHSKVEIRGSTIVLNRRGTEELLWHFLDDAMRSPYTHVIMNPEPMIITYRAAYVGRTTASARV